MKGVWRLAALLIVLVLGAGCSRQAVVLNGTERDAVLAYSESKTDNLLEGLNNNDYAMFARDFDKAMQEAIPESAFPQMRENVVGKIDRYESREVMNVESVDSFTRVIYSAHFAGEDGVTVRVVFQKDTADHQVTGLWFDSPLLRQK